MRKTLAVVAVLLVSLAAIVGTSRAANWPDEWPTATPERHGFSSPKLQNLWKDLVSRGTTGFLVIRDGKIIFEDYAPGWSRHKPHGTASLAKALVAGDSLMLAMDDGRIRPDDLACQYVPEWKNDPVKNKITIRHLATHTSGIEDAEAGETPHDQLTGWKGDFWKQPPPPRDPFTLARDIAPVLSTPGTAARYSNPGMAMLSYCLTVSLRGAPEPDLRSLLRERLLRPLGVPDAEWSAGYKGPIHVDGLPLIGCWGGAAFSPNAAARIGRLLLREGDWDGRQLISKQTVHAATTWSGTLNNLGLGWWVNRKADSTLRWPALPGDAFWGSGAGHQFLLVVPSLKLIVVRNGTTLNARADYDQGLEKYLVTPLMQCMTSSATGTAAPAYPQSPVIAELTWSPTNTIIRKADDSDNWPITWGDDDALYTAYGDGEGFEPFVPEKLSLGFAKILGTPPAFTGINVRSPSGEQRGGGARGRKASGMLMVEGRLYMWARNATNAQLASSLDHGQTWKWCDWRFTNSFGCPTFVNFGPNYSGARDDFVYVLSPDADSAYAAADQIILARVPKDKILVREHYEFLCKLDGANEPSWTRDLSKRVAVFQKTAACYRPTVTYNSALKRYLMVMPVPNARSRDSRGRIDTRPAGGLVIYDAPNPWGPWTGVYAAADWDTGPGDSASFPTKWISPDGRTLHLVFSNNDSFSVRQCRLTLRASRAEADNAPGATPKPANAN
jgi:CubicO group peptidase (beta-lactamase class C family)